MITVDGDIVAITIEDIEVYYNTKKYNSNYCYFTKDEDGNYVIGYLAGEGGTAKWFATLKFSWTEGYPY